MQEKAGISNPKLLPQSVQSLVRLFSRPLSIQADARVAFFQTQPLAADFSYHQLPTVFGTSTIKDKVLGPAHARTHSLAILSIQETKTWDVPNLELPGDVCYGSKLGFVTLLVSEHFRTIKRSWKFEERCTAILFGTPMVMTVCAPDSSNSFEMYFESFQFERR